jgi:hypothetical protein
MRVGGSERAARTPLIISLDLREGQTSAFRIVEFAIGTLLFLGNNSIQINGDRVDLGAIGKAAFGISIALLSIVNGSVFLV